MKAIIILGSARSDGNTKRIVEQMLMLNPSLGFIDLNEKNIGYFDYSHSNLDDDFISVIEKIQEHELIIFVTPVYWYTMSAVMKTFFDRITDLLEVRKDLGRKLRGMSMGSVSCGSSDGPGDSFFVPFRETADYLGMKYTGHIHTWVSKDTVPMSVIDRLREYLKITI